MKNVESVGSRNTGEELLRFVCVYMNILCKVPTAA